MKNIRVLLVDDHPVAREGVRRLLELDSQILVVDEAESGEEALDKMDSLPEVVLMDIRMPGINGIEATYQLKIRHPDVKVIILSSFGSEYLDQAIEAGASGYILKTATQTEIVGAVHQAAQGQSPIDAELRKGLLERFNWLSKRARYQGLSSRQHSILQLVADGTSSKEIAAQLEISNATLKREFKAIFNYLGAEDKAQAVGETYKRQLI